MSHGIDPGAGEREAHKYVLLVAAFGGEPEIKRERDLLAMFARWLSREEVDTLCVMVDRVRDARAEGGAS